MTYDITILLENSVCNFSVPYCFAKNTSIFEVENVMHVYNYALKI